MMSKTRKIMFVVCAAFCALALWAGIGLTNDVGLCAMAQETAFTTAADGIAIRGAAIRYRQTGKDQGLRFSLSVTGEYYEKLQTKTNVKIGMLVMPYDLCGGKLTIENTDAINEVFYSAAEGADTVNRLNDIMDPKAGEENYKEALLVLKDIPNLSYNRRVCAVGYIEENGTYTYTSAKVTSIAKVAKAAKANETNADKIADLENYLLNYTVNFYDWNGNLLTENGTQSVKYGEEFTVPVVDNGYGWYTAAGKNGENIVWSNNLYDFETEGAKETLGNMYFKVDNRERVTLTGSYEYGSGRYDAASGKYMNDGDNVTVKVGGAEAIVNTENQTYTLDNVIKGSTYDITVESDYFQTVTLNAVEADGNTQEEKVILKSPKMASETGVTYGGNGYVTIAKDTAALFAGNSATAAGEGFVVKYTLSKSSNTGWFNRGGLHVTTNATERNEHDFGLVSTGAKWMLYAKQSGVSGRDNLSNGFADFNVNDEWNVTMVYSDGVYYTNLSSKDGAKTYTTAYLEQSFTYVKGKEIVSSSVTRSLGLSSYCDSGYATIFTDISYAIGSEIARKTAKELPAAEFNVTVAGNKRFALPNAEAKDGEGFVINYTVVDNGSTANQRRGGLYIVSNDNGSERRYRFGTYQTALYLGSSDENPENRDYYWKNHNIGTGTWNATIVFYNGTYYTKFTQGETVYVKKLDSSTQSDNADKLNEKNKAVIYSTTATRNLWLHSFTDNAVKTQLNKVTYSIGNAAATAAIAKMGFEI